MVKVTPEGMDITDIPPHIVMGVSPEEMEFCELIKVNFTHLKWEESPQRFATYQAIESGRLYAKMFPVRKEQLPHEWQ